MVKEESYDIEYSHNYAYETDDSAFLFDDPHPDAAEVYAKLDKRIKTLLSSHTSAGRLYEIDLRLRPNGASGLLVSTIPAFVEYQHQHAWVWEHQALTRARYCAGDADVGALFADAAMNLRPWDLWSPEGEPRPETPEILATIEAVLAMVPDHPMACHEYIHTMEASPAPEKALPAANVLRTRVPGAGHLAHTKELTNENPTYPWRFAPGSSGEPPGSELRSTSVQVP